MGICSLLLSSCSSSDDSDTPPPGIPGNSFAYGDAQSKIESVVYTVDEQKVYTFYFSPTRGLADLEAMLLADDYIKIATSTPTGEIDLLGANNLLLYKNVDVCSATADKVDRATLTLQLTSLSTMKMNLAAAMSTGETLQAEYEGTCIKNFDPGEDPKDDYDVTLSSQIFGYYMGPDEGNAGTSGYYIALTDAEFQVQGTQFALTTDGYALVLNFYGTTGEDWKDMPTGAFVESGSFGDHTFDSEFSGVLCKAGGSQQLFTLLDPVKIVRGEGDKVTITATFVDQNYDEKTLIYEGDLKLGNATLNVYLPQIGRDVTVKGAYASGIYSGDVFDNGSGLVEVTINDLAYENREPEGYSMKLALFSTKFQDPKRERRLVPGTYTVSKTYEQGTWMPTVEIQIMGMVIPMGTYASYDDGTKEGQYSYAASGDIVVREGSNNTYTIEFDLKSLDGYAIRGSYTGSVDLQDQSDDDENDGTSSLEADYAMKLGYLPRGDCFPRNEINIPSLGGNVPLAKSWEYSGLEYGYQFIQFGTTKGTWEYTDEYPEEIVDKEGNTKKGSGKLIEGDILGVELLVAKDTENKITPGTYTVTPTRYPAHFRPGVCVRGYRGPQGTDGTSWQFITSAIGWGQPNGYYDPEYRVSNGWLNVQTVGGFASIYSGTITVSKAEGGENWYTFTIDGKDVLKHTITGSWTGPIYLGGTDTPIEQSENTVQTTAKRHTPSFREAKSQIAKKLSDTPMRQPLK